MRARQTKPLDGVKEAWFWLGLDITFITIPLMSVSTIESFATQAALSSLNAYQKHLSPRKGFSCAHRLLHGQESCSEYVKHLLLTQNLMTVIQMAPQRFKACKAAAQTLQNQQASGGCIVIPCCLPIPL